MKNNTGTDALASEKDLYKSEAKASLPRNKRLYRHLHHVDIIGQFQFITFRTHESVDSYIKKILHSNLENGIKQYRADEYLDTSRNGTYLNSEALEYMRNFLLKNNQDLFDTIAFSIMPNHFHILLKQNNELDKIIQRLKGGSSFGINKILGKQGKFWANEYYDKAIRDESHFIATYDYIKHNPKKAKLEDYEQRFYGIYE